MNGVCIRVFKFGRMNVNCEQEKVKVVATKWDVDLKRE